MAPLPDICYAQISGDRLTTPIALFPVVYHNVKMLISWKMMKTRWSGVFAEWKRVNSHNVREYTERKPSGVSLRQEWLSCNTHWQRSNCWTVFLWEECKRTWLSAIVEWEYFFTTCFTFKNGMWMVVFRILGGRKIVQQHIVLLKLAIVWARFFRIALLGWDMPWSGHPVHQI